MSKKIVSVCLVLLLSLPVFSAPALGYEPAMRPNSCNDYEWTIMKIVNKVRIDRGYLPLTMMEPLQKASYIRLVELVGNYSHTRPDGRKFSSVLAEAGLSFGSTGENIATGHQTPKQVMDAWMGSPGHEKNIISDKYYHMGVGFSSDGWRGTSWEMLFLVDGCYTEGISLVKPDGELSFPAGTVINDMELSLRVDCGAHGTSYMPVIEEMCSGYAGSADAADTVKIKYGDFETEVQVRYFNAPVSSSDQEDETGDWDLPFNDVSKDDWFYSSVAYVYVTGIMTGSSDTEFSPDAPVDRATMATVLYRLEKEPEVKYRSVFTDVPVSWFSDAVIWAYGSDIIQGYGEGRFGPNDVLTREQFAVMLYRYASFKGHGTELTSTLARFSDGGEVSSWAVDAVRWAVGAGLMTGTDGNTLNPRAVVNRSQCAVMLARFMMLGD